MDKQVRTGARRRRAPTPKPAPPKRSREEPVPAASEQVSDEDREERLPFDIGETRRGKPESAYDAWPVDAPSDVPADDPTGR
jgi:hypothetical protein